jgi:hypothetical protein
MALNAVDHHSATSTLRESGAYLEDHFVALGRGPSMPL